MDESFHYPPELLSLLVDTIPLLCRSKNDVLLFFRGAGTADDLVKDLHGRLRADAKSISKYEIARTILARVNERGDSYLKVRRELIKRVTEYEDFSSCWPADQLKAKGAVAEVRRIVNVKDSFTRIAKEREREREQNAEATRLLREAQRAKRTRVASAKAELYALFALENEPSKRGLALEKVLNELFAAHEILFAENFKRRDPDNEKVVEQIDGMIQLRGQLILVEMKWTSEPVGVDLVAQPLVRLFSRGAAKGLLISTSGFTDPAIAQCRQALALKIMALCPLQELVMALEEERDLAEFFREKFLAVEASLDPIAVARS